jgi:hypothetical protein
VWVRCGRPTDRLLVDLGSDLARGTPPSPTRLPAIGEAVEPCNRMGLSPLASLCPNPSRAADIPVCQNLILPTCLPFMRRGRLSATRGRVLASLPEGRLLRFSSTTDSQAVTCASSTSQPSTLLAGFCPTDYCSQTSHNHVERPEARPASPTWPPCGVKVREKRPKPSTKTGWYWLRPPTRGTPSAPTPSTAWRLEAPHSTLFVTIRHI